MLSLTKNSFPPHSLTSNIKVLTEESLSFRVVKAKTDLAFEFSFKLRWWEIKPQESQYLCQNTNTVEKSSHQLNEKLTNWAEIRCNTLVPAISKQLFHHEPHRLNGCEGRDFTRRRISLSSLFTGVGGKRSRKPQILERAHEQGKT